MRIIAGSKARTKLLGPTDNETRPVTDRVKESLFAILGDRVEGAHVVDLFCGTGSMALEALSRGACRALMMDISAKAIRRLQHNINKLNYQQSVTVIKADAFRIGVPYSYMRKYATSPCNMVFLDPPYKLSRRTDCNSPLGKLLLKLNTQLSTGALLIIRHEKRVVVQEQYGDIVLCERRDYGSMSLSFLVHGKDDTQ